MRRIGHPSLVIRPGGVVPTAMGGPHARGHHGPADRRIAVAMGFGAATLAVMALLHLAGILHAGGPPFRPADAGIAEAIIGVALTYGASTLARGRAHARSIAVATTGFAIVGFIVGLNFTVRGGDAIDIAYQAAVLPLLLLTLIALARGSGVRS